MEIETGTTLALVFLVAVSLVGIAGILDVSSLPGGLGLWALVLSFLLLTGFYYWREVND